MAAIPTAPTAIDKKLYRILLASDSSQFSTMSALARFVEANQYPEFSYSRNDETQYASAETIYRYVSYAKTVGLLDDKLASSKAKRDIRSLEEFQQWLSDTVMRFMNNSNCSIDKIRDAARALLVRFPAQLPTPANVRAYLKNPLPADVFRMSVRIISLMRPRALEVKSRQVILIPKSIEA